MRKTTFFAYFRQAIDDVRAVLFPEPCLGCEAEIRMPDAPFCISCTHDMPLTDHFMHHQNVVFDRLSGRVAIDRGASVLFFTQGGIVQEMLHRLKYQGQREVGQVVGKMAASLWQQQNWPLPDIAIPVPLHKKKIAKRGYNQSAVFLHALCEELGVRCCEDMLEKDRETASQTGKNREQRAENVRNVFRVTDGDSIRGKHILLADDVITTGATLEACILALQQHAPAAIYVLVMAVAR